tara:strand:+ start:3383 stop:3913 length:531 start_codon:yes stop_codon:yes gene_type:complete
MASVRDAGSTTTNTSSPNYTSGSNKNLYSSNSSNLEEPFSSLETLSRQILRRYGDMHPGTVDGDVILMFIEFANFIIEDLRAHPYWDSRDIDYYKHPEEVREIPDIVISAGLLFFYSEQQNSKKADTYGARYYRTMNSVLYNRKYGHQKIEMQAVDRGDQTKVGATDKVDPQARWG